jgi:GTP-binding protein LepA
VTAPNVTYRLTLTNGDLMMLENPSQFPEVTQIDLMEEPFMGLSVITPNEYIGTVMELAKSNRAIYKKSEYLDAERQMATFSIPLNELITNFFDQLKSRTKGYASMDYWFEDFQPSYLVKVNMLINGDPVDALSFISHRDKAQSMSRRIAAKLKEIIPQQMYEVAIQGAVGGNVLCRETIRALRKNVTAKCYGGDISRKRKLLEKQKEGKKKMKQIGRVQVPKEAFLSVLKAD